MNGKIFCAHELEDIVVKCSIRPKWSTRKQSMFSAILSESQGRISRNRKHIPKTCVEPHKTPKVKAILRKKNNLETSHCMISNYITKLE